MLNLQSNDKVFSAGLDLNEMYRPDKDRARLLWIKLQDVWLALYSCDLPTAAAINANIISSFIWLYIQISIVILGSRTSRRLLTCHLMRVSSYAAEMSNWFQ